MRLFVLLAIVIAGRWAGAAEQWPSLVPFSPEMYKADENARWLYAVPEGVEMTDEFVSPPRPGQDREAWLKALRTYREMVRAGGAAGMIELGFDGVRSWTRLSLEASRGLALLPGDCLEARIEARWKQGNGEICAAFDFVDAPSGAWVGWSGVLASADTPRDDAWHTHTLRLEVPATELQDVLFRPIFGLDATHNATPGVVDIRDIAIAEVAAA
ncbi:MAG: hypothetical protein HYV26_21680, partial [Candidatus Hydrogenedentes bacterium]|nr:hypothetical protein [Candidatus Hydrogenedentota bacterium]